MVDPPPIDPPPVDPPGIAFRDEVVPWLDDDEEEEEGAEDEEGVVDLSDLNRRRDAIDAGVTSGADPSAWDPILVEPLDFVGDD